MRKFEKISVDSAEYKDEQEFHRTDEKAETIFGQHELESVDGFHRMEQAGMAHLTLAKNETPEQHRIRLGKKLQDSQEELRAIGIIDPPLGVMLVKDFLEEGLTDSEIRTALQEDPEIKNLLEEHPGVEDAASGLVVHFLQGEGNVLPPSAYERMLRIHVRNFEARTQVFEHTLLGYADQFKKKAARMIREGMLSLSEEQLISRMQGVRIEAQDALVAKLEDKWGEFVPDQARAYIAQQVPSEDIEAVVTHELFHAVSGRTAGVRQHEFSSENVAPREEAVREIVHERVGTQIGIGVIPDIIPRGRFKWLNEAITEKLTMNFLGLKEGTYEKERRLFELLCAQGASRIDEATFYAAYFEDFDPDTQEKIPNWKAMMDAINEAYEPGFLTQLDKVIGQRGIDAAITYLEEKKDKRNKEQSPR